MDSQRRKPWMPRPFLPGETIDVHVFKSLIDETIEEIQSAKANRDLFATADAPDLAELFEDKLTYYTEQLTKLRSGQFDVEGYLTKLKNGEY